MDPRRVSHSNTIRRLFLISLLEHAVPQTNPDTHTGRLTDPPIPITVARPPFARPPTVKYVLEYMIV
jgi:hypothetical protein